MLGDIPGVKVCEMVRRDGAIIKNPRAFKDSGDCTLFLHPPEGITSHRPCESPFSLRQVFWLPPYFRQPSHPFIGQWLLLPKALLHL